MKPVLDSFSDTVVYTGDLGTGTVIKLAHNLVRRGIGLAIGEGIVLGAKAGVRSPASLAMHALGLGCPIASAVQNSLDTVFKETMMRPPVSALVCREKTSASPRNWAAEITCRCRSPRWSSKPWLRRSTEHGPRRAPRRISVCKKKPPASRCAEKCSNGKVFTAPLTSLRAGFGKQEPKLLS